MQKKGQEAQKEWKDEEQGKVGQGESERACKRKSAPVFANLDT